MPSHSNEFSVHLFVVLLIYDGIFFMLNRSLPLLLPAIEDGIFNDNWRIRQSSVELLGDLLFKVATSSMCIHVLPFLITLYHIVTLPSIGGWNFWESNLGGWKRR